MAESDPILKTDVADPGAVSDGIQKEYAEFVAYLEGVVGPAIQKTAQNLNNVGKGLKFDNLQDLKTVNEYTQQANDLALLNSKYKKLEAQANAALSVQRKNEIIEKKSQIDLDNKLLQGKTKEEALVRKNASAYSQLTAELNKNRAVAKDLQAQQALGNQLTDEQAITLKNATAETQRLDIEVKKIDYSVGQAQRNVGNYNNQLGTLAKSVKGFGALGRILSRALGIDPEIFNGIREAGTALKDIKHISEGAKLAKEGEAAANIANTEALQAEKVAQEEESVAAGISTGGIILLIGAIVGAGVAIYEYVTALKEQREEEKKIKELEEERFKIFLKTKELQSKNSTERFGLQQEELVISGKITEAEKNRRIEGLNLEIALQDSRRKEKNDIEERAKAYGVDLDAYEKYIKRKSEVKGISAPEALDVDISNATTQAFDKFTNDKLAIQKTAAEERYQLQSESNNKITKVNQDAQKKDEKGEDEALKKIAELKKKYTDDLLKQQAQTNVEKEIADYKIQVQEINAIKATEEKKFAVRIALEKDHIQRMTEATLKDNEEAQKKFDEANKKKAEADKKTLEGITKEQKDHLKVLEEIAKEDTDIFKKKEEEKKKLHEEYIKERNKLEDDVTKGIEEGLQKRSELQQQADENAIDFHKRMIAVQTALAAGGKDNILAQEQASATKAEEKKLQDAKKAAKLQEEITLVQVLGKTIQDAIDNHENVFTAIAKGDAAEALVKTMFSNLFSGYYEGTDSLDGRNAIDLGTGKDNLLIRAHKGERIFGVEDSARVEGYTNDELINNALAFENIYRPQFKAANVSTTQVSSSSHDAQLAQLVDRKFDSLQKAIESKPTQMIEVDGLREVIETVKRGGITTKVRYKTSTTRPSLRLNG